MPSRGLKKLDIISPANLIYKGIDSIGRFQFREDLINNRAGYFKVTGQPLTERYIITLGLIEVYYELGRDKVDSKYLIEQDYCSNYQTLRYSTF